MSKAKRTALLVAALLIGGAIGSYATWEVAKSGLAAYELSDVAHFSAYLDIQRSRGTPDAYEAALREYLSVLDVRERNKSGLFSEHMYAVDRALAYARLSSLAQRRGDADASASYLALAEALCPRLEWTNCSSGDIVTMAERLDRGNTWAAPELKAATPAAN